MSSLVIIRELEEQLYDARMHVLVLENELKKELHKLQSTCHHDFVEERDSDGHRTIRTYTCKHCRYVK